MYVCLCRAVRDHAVEDAVRAGARTPEDVSAATQAGTVCGNCLPLVDDIVREILAALDGPEPSRGRIG